MMRITTDDGRVAWFCGDERAHRAELEAMVAELFGGIDRVVIAHEESADESS